MTFDIVQKPLMPEHPRPIVSLGAGGIVKDAHYPAYSKAGFQVAGLYDVNPQRAAEMASSFGVPVVYGSISEAVANAPQDAIFDIAVPASAIVDILPQIPERRAVLIQKPLGENLEGARKLVDICRSKHLIAAVNFQLRYAPFVIAARGLIEQGAIGEVHDMEVRVMVYTPWQLWPFMIGIPRVEILYHSVHYLDVIRSFLGDPSGVYAKTVKHPKQEKLASTRSTIIMDYGEMIRANVSVNHGHEYGLHNQESYIKWEGTQGAIKARLGVLMNYPQGEPDQFEYCILQDGQPAEWTMVKLDGTWFPDAFIGTMASLMRKVEGSAQDLPTSVEDACRTMALVEAAYASSTSGATAIPQ